LCLKCHAKAVKDSAAKSEVERQKSGLIAGFSGFGIYDALVSSFTTNEDGVKKGQVPEPHVEECKIRANAKKIKALLTNCEYLEGDEAKSEQGIRIYGAPWTQTIAVSGVFQVPAAFNRNPLENKANFKPTKPTWIDAPAYIPKSMTEATESLEKCWDRVPEGIDVLITHGPPLNILDEDFGDHYGDALLAKAVQRVAPAYHVFGHIHPSYGAKKIGATTFINASSVTCLQDARHAPIVFDVPYKAKSWTDSALRLLDKV